MSRASHATHIERLNRTWSLLARGSVADAMSKLVQRYSISARQAYRYIQQARGLKQPLPPSEIKVAFTVKLPQELVQQVREQARSSGLSLSELVSRALRVLLVRRQGRG